MRTLSILIVLSLVACKDKPKDTPAAGSAVAPAGSGSAAAPAGSGSAAAPGSGASDPAPVAAEPGCEGWRASKIEHMGMGQSSVSIECAAGKFTVTSTLEEPRGGAETSKGTITRETWNQLWQALDAAGWTKLADTCPEVNPPPDSVGITELELSITDGKTKKQITCHGANVTAVHEAIMKALDDADEKATKAK